MSEYGHSGFKFNYQIISALQLLKLANVFAKPQSFYRFFIYVTKSKALPPQITNFPRFLSKGLYSSHPNK
ncbi:MAG: hypothetical protein ACI95X_001299 [Paraglaciecola sp.]|jgi:hypothetical protein